MNLIVCVDDKNGMAFNRRRQSQDREVRKRICEISRNSILRMSYYSKSQFTEANVNIIAGDDFLFKAERDDFCFVELSDPRSFEDKIRKIILFKWNRLYPADVFFSIELKKSGWKRVDMREFRGYSHDHITEEVYLL